MKGALCLIAALSSFALARAQSPIVRAHLEPSSGIIVGEPVRLVVEVLAPNYMTGSPDFPGFELENAIVVLPQERAQNVSERIGSMTYAGLIETYTLYPQQAGDFQVPPAQISVTYAAHPPNSTTTRVPLPSLAFHADLPPAARGMGYFLPTTRLTLEQRWDSPLNRARVGDTLTRTLTVTATKMQAMLIPPLPIDAPAGIRVYQAEPTVQDYKTSRGDFVYGRRAQSAQYLIQKVGDYTLPAVELKWWNLSTKRMVTATVPAVHFTAAANPQAIAELPPEPEAVVTQQPVKVGFWRKYGKPVEGSAAAMLGLLLLIWLAVRVTPRIIREVRAWRTRVVHSEPYLFRKCVRACCQNDAPEAYAQMLRWLRLLRPGLSLCDFVEKARSQELAAEVDALGEAVYAHPDERARWTGSGLARQLKQVRRETDLSKPEYKTLPAMNPALRR